MGEKEMLEIVKCKVKCRWCDKEMSWYYGNRVYAITETIHQRVCMPYSQNESAETIIHHFCNLDCMTKWTSKKHIENTDKEKSISYKTLEQQIIELWASKDLEMLKETCEYIGKGRFVWTIIARNYHH